MSSRLFIENIDSEEVLKGRVSSEDLAFVENFSNQGRRCEALAWRAIVRREVSEGVRISYDEYGAPQVDEVNVHISVSHSRGVVALLLSDRPCAVDIEQTDRNFRKVADRYLSERESAIAEANNLYAEMWCAKEALYKYYKKGALDLINDLVIMDYLPQESAFVARVLDGEPLRVKVKREGNLAIALID